MISLPASDTAGSPHTQADDVEVGGMRGREALDRLRNVVGRVESSWRPASAEEGFEIVRRRLFEPLAEPDAVQATATWSRAPSPTSTARSSRSSRPSAATPTTRSGIKAAYPIHPEIFDRLYTDWSTLVKFQRTRGVLRLMAAVIHSLWEKGDRNPLILPANIPIDDPRVQSELTRYLSDNWVPVIEKDVDGPNSLPLRIDGEVPNLGKFARDAGAWRARSTSARRRRRRPRNRGLEDRRVKLGCVMPGESPAVFGDALRRLAAAATYLYQDGPRYWYATQPTVTKLAEDRAEQLKRDPDKVAQELDERLRADLRKTGDFAPRPPAAAVGRRRARRPRRAAGRAAGPSIPTARRPAARPRRRPRRSSSRAATRRGSTATRSSSSRPTRRACRTSTRRCAGTSPGSRSSTEKDALEPRRRIRCGRPRRRSRRPTAR